MLKIGIAGCGAIGSSLASFIRVKLASQARLAGLYDIDRGRAARLAVKAGDKRLAVSSLRGLIKCSDLIIEAASASASFDIARQALSAGRDIMVMSVGGILFDYPALQRLSRKKKARLFVPSGAICGVDGLKAAHLAGIKRVVLTTRKPPGALTTAPHILKKKIDLEGLREDRVVFSGSAAQAVKAFPQNINVAAVLSLAGIGAEHTLVRIVASPGTKTNTHEIEIDSAAGRIFTRTENLAHPDNPKTSYLAFLSAAAALRQILEPVRIGT